MTRGAFKAVLEVEEGLLADGLDDDWSGCVRTASGILDQTEHEDQSDQSKNSHKGISVGTVKIEHL